MLDVLTGKTLKPIGQLLDRHFLSQSDFSASLPPGQLQHTGSVSELLEKSVTDRESRWSSTFRLLIGPA